MIEHKGKCKELQLEIEKAKEVVQQKEKQLQRFIDSCCHKYSEAIYNPRFSGGYRYEGDPVGTMGVDWRPGGYIPKTEHPRWERTCIVCGYVQKTERKESVNIKGLQQERPVWS
jgi:hypothetical protein